MEQLTFESAIEAGIFWLTRNLSSFFNSITSLTDSIFETVNGILLVVPWYGVVALVALCAYFLKGVQLAIVSGLMLVFVQTLNFWLEGIATLSMIIIAVSISIMFGLPLGIFAAKSDGFDKILRPILDAMQTIPTFVYLIPAVMFFGIGNVPGIMATVVFAMPTMIRLSNLAIRQVPKPVVEAAQAFGASPWQILLKVELPVALPTFITAITQTVMMTLSMVVTASMIGADGLGKPVLIAIQRVDVGLGAKAGLCVLAIAILLDRLLRALVQKQKFVA
ncbi:MAG: ABC transporter permease subunit [Myxococcales bacterium]|nr:ABC transporter permease subunit [Myxococcales bacterium]USN49906.1 MAG: ABC transporter permease subunit [Myxococcales bacterium]